MIVLLPVVYLKCNLRLLLLLLRKYNFPTPTCFMHLASLVANIITTPLCDVEGHDPADPPFQNLSNPQPLTSVRATPHLLGRCSLTSRVQKSSGAPNEGLCREVTGHWCPREESVAFYKEDHSPSRSADHTQRVGCDTRGHYYCNMGDFSCTPPP